MACKGPGDGDFAVVRDQGPPHLYRVAPISAREFPQADRVVPFLDDQAIVLRKFIQVLRRSELRKVGGRRTKDPVIAGEASGNVMRRNHVADADVEVDLVLSQIEKVVEHVQADLDRRVLARELRKAFPVLTAVDSRTNPASTAGTAQHDLDLVSG